MNKKLFKADFKDIFVCDDGAQTTFSYRTGLCVYEEVFLEGRYMSAGWNTAGYTLNVLESYPTRFAGYSRNLIGEIKNSKNEFAEAQSFTVEADGVSLDGSWQFVGHTEETEIIADNQKEILHGRVVLRSNLKPVEVVVHTVLDGTPVMSRWLEVKNTSDTNINISKLLPMCGGIEIIDSWKEYMKGVADNTKIYSLGYMDHARWAHEGYFRWRDVPNNYSGFSCKRFQDQCFRQPFFVLKNNLLGNIMIAQLGYSGGCDFKFRLDTDTSTAKLGFEVSIEAPNPILVLQKEETFEMPKLHIGMLHGDLDDAINLMHKHIRQTEFTIPAPFSKKGWVEGGMGCERIMDMRAVKHFADTICEVGGETLIIDAGWYCPPGKEDEWWDRAGHWYPDKERWPNGIEEARDYAHSKGLKFGLWLELEAIGKLAGKTREDHTNLLAECKSADDRLLDMTNPEAVAWAEKELSRVIEEYGIEIFRLDYNMQMNFTLYRTNKGGTPESSFLRYCKNVSDMFNRLKRKYPQVIFENCAGGGERTDVEFVKNFTHTWVSDFQIAPRSFAITNGMTMVLPPEWVDRLVSGMNCHTRGSLDFQIRNTLFGRPSTNDYNAMGSKMNKDQIGFIRHSIDVYKKHIRPYIDDSLIFHHTPELVSATDSVGGVVEHPQGYGVIERASFDGKHGVVGLFKLADSDDQSVVTVFPKGIDPALNYNITFDNLESTVKVSGYALYNDGVKLKVQESVSSELLIYEAE